MSEDRYQIPGDWIPGPDFMTSMSRSVPALYAHQMFLIDQLHKGDPATGRPPITGKGITIAINDTGWIKHDLLPEPVFAISMVGEDPKKARHPHGPHVSGIALGRFGEDGRALGVAPGANLITVQVLNSQGSGPTSAINAGRERAGKEGADITSESLGDNGGPDIPEDIKSFDRTYESGVSLCVCAMGNNGMNGDGRPGSYKQNFGVGALNQRWERAGFSSVSNNLDIMFPGESIPSCNLSNGFMLQSGTSQATPGIAGCFALIMEWMQIVGIPRPMGWSAWRQWIQQPQFIKDLGDPGKDRATGFGAPKMINIFEWMLLPRGA